MSKNLSLFSSSDEFSTPPLSEEIQFTYYIVPEDDRPPIVWAMTATAYTLTAYTQPTAYDHSLTAHLRNPGCPITVATMREFIKIIQLEKAAKVSVTFETPVDAFKRAKPDFYSVHREDPEHPPLHSTDPEELFVMHYHLRNPHRPLTLVIVRDFIEMIQQSEQDLIERNDLRAGEIFMTRTVGQDIISRYADFAEKQARGEVTGIYNASNSEFYEKHINQFTMSIHGRCLALPTRFMGCTLDNPETPEAIRSLYSSDSFMNTVLTENEAPMISTETLPPLPIIIDTEPNVESSTLSSSSWPAEMDLSEAVKTPSMETSSTYDIPPTRGLPASSIENNPSILALGLPLASLMVSALIILHLCGFFKRNNQLEKLREEKEKTSGVESVTLKGFLENAEIIAGDGIHNAPVHCQSDADDSMCGTEEKGPGGLNTPEDSETLKPWEQGRQRPHPSHRTAAQDLIEASRSGLTLIDSRKNQHHDFHQPLLNPQSKEGNNGRCLML